MRDAELIYNAILRAERKMETHPEVDPTCSPETANLARFILQVIRTEIGNGMDSEWPR